MTSYRSAPVPEDTFEWRSSGLLFSESLREFNCTEVLMLDDVSTTGTWLPLVLLPVVGFNAVDATLPPSHSLPEDDGVGFDLCCLVDMNEELFRLIPAIYGHCHHILIAHYSLIKLFLAFHALPSMNSTILSTVVALISVNASSVKKP